MNVQEMTTQANYYWKIDSLRVDLENAKYFEKNRERKEKLTDNEYHCLCGLLCRYKPATIAKILQKESASIRTELAKGLYRYIEFLIQNKTDKRYRVEWSDIPIQLEKLGYKKSLSVPSTPPEAIVEWTIWIDIPNIGKMQLNDIVKLLQELASDGLLTLKKTEPGSVVLFLESTQAGYEQIEALFRDDRLAELLGVPVLDVRLRSAILSANPNTLVNLNQWLQGNFAEAVQAGWQMVEEILQPSQLGFMRADVIKRALSINLGDSTTVGLVVQITRTTDEEVDVLALVYPTGENINYLPENLKLTVLLGEETEEIQVGSEVNLLRQEMTGLVTGEQFSVQISLGDMSVTVDFTI